MILEFEASLSYNGNAIDSSTIDQSKYKFKLDLQLRPLDSQVTEPAILQGDDLVFSINIRDPDELQNWMLDFSDFSFGDMTGFTTSVIDLTDGGTIDSNHEVFIYAQEDPPTCYERNPQNGKPYLLVRTDIT